MRAESTSGMVPIVAAVGGGAQCAAEDTEAPSARLGCQEATGGPMLCSVEGGKVELDPEVAA
jgi:hypothetical protein